MSLNAMVPSTVVANYGQNLSEDEKVSPFNEQSTLLSKPGAIALAVTCGLETNQGKSLKGRVKNSPESSLEEDQIEELQDLEKMAETEEVKMLSLDLQETVAHSKLHKDFFIYDEYVCDDSIKDDMGNLKNQMLDLMRTVPLASTAHVTDLLNAFSLEELVILNDLLTIYQKKELSLNNQDIQHDNYKAKLAIFQNELEGWSIVFNRYKKFGSLLSEVRNTK